MLRKISTNSIDEATAASFLCQMLECVPSSSCTWDTLFTLCHLRSVLHYLRTSKAVPIIHRDIKPENILVQKHTSGPYAGQLRLKLADFGWAVAMVPDSYRVTLCGTPEYMPPEVVTEDAYSGAFDVWTLGVLLYEMLLGTTPFEAAGEGMADETDRMDAIMRSIVQGHFTVPETISEEAEDLLRGMLAADQHERMTPGAIRRHPWVVAHCGEPDAADFAPSKAGSKLVSEAKRRAAAAAAGGSDTPADEAPAASSPAAEELATPKEANAHKLQESETRSKPVVDSKPVQQAAKSTGGPRRVLKTASTANKTSSAKGKDVPANKVASAAAGVAVSTKSVTAVKGASVKRTIKRAPKTRSATGAMQVR